MVILVDTSIWVEHLRGTGSRGHRAFRELAAGDPAEVATCEPVAMELLAGPTDPLTVRRLEDQLGTLEDLEVDVSRDFRSAAALARGVRGNGHAVRSVIDCLIAAIALRNEVALWHRDEDFVRIAEVSDLQQLDLR